MLLLDFCPCRKLPFKTCESQFISIDPSDWQLTELSSAQIPNAIAEAQKACEEDPTSAPCAVAWDEVEELTAEAAHQRDREKTSGDPLEKYCADNPESDECRTYED